jgi:hypothetical protein
MMARWRLLIHLRSSVWLVPVLCVLAGSGVALGAILSGVPDGYRAMNDRESIKVMVTP